MLPLDQLRKLDSEVSLAIGSLTAMQLPLEGFNLKARARNGQLNLQELRGGLYGGRLDSSASLDVRQAQPLLTLQYEQLLATPSAAFERALPAYVTSAFGGRKQTLKAGSSNMPTPCQGFHATFPVPMVQLSNSRIEHASAPLGHSPLATFSAEHLYSRDKRVCLPAKCTFRKSCSP